MAHCQDYIHSLSFQLMIEATDIDQSAPALICRDFQDSGSYPQGSDPPNFLKKMHIHVCIYLYHKNEMDVKLSDQLTGNLRLDPIQESEEVIAALCFLGVVRR